MDDKLVIDYEGYDDDDDNPEWYYEKEVDADKRSAEIEDIPPECWNAFWGLIFVGEIVDTMIPTEYVEPELPY